jgi:hypothetical protein
MKLTFNLEDITAIEFIDTDKILVWFNGGLDIVIQKIDFEDWLNYKEYDQVFTYDEKDIFEHRVKEYLESKCTDEPVPTNNSALIKESLDLALQLGKKLLVLNKKAQDEITQRP